jgi:hypothetical protein
LSDADNQMGGTGGETGAPPDKAHEKHEKVDPDEESKDSFPASDPPANY